MSTSASVAKHPLHPMLVVFPIGLWIFSLVSDFIFSFREENPGRTGEKGKHGFNPPR